MQVSGTVKLDLESSIPDLTIDFQCDLVCNGGFVHSKHGKSYARCHFNPRKQDETWFPNPRRPKKGYAQCVPDVSETTCDNFPTYKDLTFFLLTNELSGGIDGYSDDEEPKLEAMFSGKRL